MKVFAALLLALAMVAGAQAACSGLYGAPVLASTSISGTNLVTVIRYENQANNTYTFSYSAGGALCTSDASVGVADCSAVTCCELTTTQSLATALNLCGWQQFVSGEQDIRSNTLTLEQVSNDGVVVNGVPVVHTQIQTIKLSMSFNLTARVETSLEVFPAAITFSATVTQAINPITKIATITYVTSVQAPYKVDNVTSSGGVLTASGFTTGACAGTTSCTQITTFTVNAAAVCQLSGTYSLRAFLTCSDANVGCATLSPYYADSDLTLTSDNFCLQVVEVADIGAVMTLSNSAANQLAGIATNDYSYGGTIYGGVQFSIEAGLLIETVQATQVQIISNCTGSGCPSTITVDGTTAEPTLTSYGWAGALTAVSVNAVGGNNAQNQYIFKYVLNGATVRFDNGATTGNVKQSVVADFVINYRDAANQKRTQIVSLAAGTPVGLTASAEGSIGPAAAGTSSESTVLGVTQGTVIVVGCTFAAVIAVVVAAAVVSSRRRAAARSYAKTQSSSELNLDLRAQGVAAAAPAGQLPINDLRTVQSAYDASNHA